MSLMARREFGALTHDITDCGRLPDLGVDAKTSMVRCGRPWGFSTGTGAVHIDGRQFGKRDVEMVVFLVKGWLEESQIKDQGSFDDILRARARVPVGGCGRALGRVGEVLQVAAEGTVETVREFGRISWHNSQRVAAVTERGS